MAFCTHHPQVETASGCARCGRPFCDSCLVEFLGQRLCGLCRDAGLAAMRTRQTVDPAQVVLWARIYDGVALALNVLMGALYGAGGGIMLAMPGFFGSATSQSQAPPPQMRQVFSIEAAVFIGLAVLAVIVSFAAFLPPLIGLRPGRRLYWGWQIGALVVGVLSGIGFGVLGCVGLVGAVVLMVYWFRPEVREYVTGDAPAFGM